MQPLLDESHEFQPDLTGTWYAGEGDPGWGLSLNLAGDGDPTSEFGVLFYFDSNGFPRWAAGVADEPGLMISRGDYLTDTLTASESFADMYGGNTANYNAYLQRDGVQYIPQTMINGWTNFFNSTALQPPG